MRKYPVVLTSLFLLACGDPDVTKIKEIVKDRLVDPGSVEFGTAMFSGQGDTACIEFNAKNRMGGFAGTHIASVKKQGSNWVVDSMDERASFCSNTGKIVKAR
jgi:hypothetical protein